MNSSKAARSFAEPAGPVRSREDELIEHRFASAWWSIWCWTINRLYDPLRQVWNFMQNFRTNGRGYDWTTLPGNFKRNGYLVMGTGKTFHPGTYAEGSSRYLPFTSSWRL